jgi:hypothetical protein
MRGRGDVFEWVGRGFGEAGCREPGTDAAGGGRGDVLELSGRGFGVADCQDPRADATGTSSTVRST